MDNIPRPIDLTSTGEAPYLDLIVGLLKNEIKASQQRFTAAITRASFDASAMYFGVALGAVLICASISGGFIHASGNTGEHSTVDDASCRPAFCS